MWQNALFRKHCYEKLIEKKGEHTLQTDQKPPEMHKSKTLLVVFYDRMVDKTIATSLADRMCGMQ